MTRKLILILSMTLIGSMLFAIPAECRMYASTTGRFLQRDPIGHEDIMNLYQYTDSVGKPLTFLKPINETNPYLYTGNNPINRIDPLGLWYLDLNFTWIGPWFVGGTTGWMINGTGIYSYNGGAAGIPGPGGSVTASQQDPCEGWNTSIGGGVTGLGGQVGIDRNGRPFYEGGVQLSLGGGNQIYYVNPPWRWPWNR